MPICLYILNKTDLKSCLCDTFDAPHGRGRAEGDCRATGMPPRALNSANTAAWEETVEFGNFLFLRKYVSFWKKNSAWEKLISNIQCRVCHFLA